MGTSRTTSTKRFFFVSAILTFLQINNIVMKNFSLHSTMEKVSNFGFFENLKDFRKLVHFFLNNLAFEKLFSINLLLNLKTKSMFFIKTFKLVRSSGDLSVTQNGPTVLGSSITFNMTYINDKMDEELKFVYAEEFNKKETTVSMYFFKFENFKKKLVFYVGARKQYQYD